MARSRETSVRPVRRCRVVCIQRRDPIASSTSLARQIIRPDTVQIRFPEAKVDRDLPERHRADENLIRWAGKRGARSGPQLRRIQQRPKENVRVEKEFQALRNSSSFIAKSAPIRHDARPFKCPSRRSPGACSSIITMTRKGPFVFHASGFWRTRCDSSSAIAVVSTVVMVPRISPGKRSQLRIRRPLCKRLASLTRCDRTAGTPALTIDRERSSPRFRSSYSFDTTTRPKRVEFATTMAASSTTTRSQLASMGVTMGAFTAACQFAVPGALANCTV